jgi:hypothetical protein
MAHSIGSILQRQIDSSAVREDGQLTRPRSFGSISFPPRPERRGDFDLATIPFAYVNLNESLENARAFIFSCLGGDAQEVARALNANGVPG